MEDAFVPRPITLEILHHMNPNFTRDPLSSEFGVIPSSLLKIWPRHDAGSTAYVFEIRGSIYRLVFFPPFLPYSLKLRKYQHFFLGCGGVGGGWGGGGEGV